MMDVSHDVAAFLRILHQTTDGVLPFEIRILNVGPGKDTYSGFFNDIDAAVRSIEAFDKRHSPKAIYTTMNPFELGKRERTNSKKEKYTVNFQVKNRIDKARIGECMTNADATRRRWLFVDVDPVRPTGINASDVQMNTAIATAKAIRDDFVGKGWPEPLAGMSGNGSYLLWRTDLTYDEENRRLISDCIYAILQKYSPNASTAKEVLSESISLGSYSDEANAESIEMDIDRSIHNVARICKILGTDSRKGPHSELRPQRKSWYHMPQGELGIVSQSQLEELASTVEKVSKKTKSISSLKSEPREIDFSSSEEIDKDDPMMREIIEETREKLRKIPLKYWIEYESWYAIGAALHATHSSMLSDWIEFSKQASNFQVGKCEEKWAQYQRDKGITNSTLNFYIPNDYAASSWIRKKLAVSADIDEKEIQESLFEDFQRWNRDQKVPHAEGALMLMFKRSIEFESKRRTNRGYSVGIDAARAIESQPIDLISNSASEDGDVAEPVKEKNTYVDNLADKETLTKEEKEKSFGEIKRIASRIAAPALSDVHLEYIADWQLYICQETPVVYELSMPGRLSDERVRITLSTGDLQSPLSFEKKTLEHAINIPSAFLKVWRSVVNELLNKVMVKAPDPDRDELSLMAREIAKICYESITNIKERTDSSVMNARAFWGTPAFYQGDPAAVTAFWLNPEAIYNELKTRMPSVNPSVQKCRKAFRDLGIEMQVNTPRGKCKTRPRMSLVRPETFRRICDRAGMEFYMKTNSGLSDGIGEHGRVSSSLLPESTYSETSTVAFGPSSDAPF